jgi:hypothetical protein
MRYRTVVIPPDVVSAPAEMVEFTCGEIYQLIISFLGYYFFIVSGAEREFWLLRKQKKRTKREENRPDLHLRDRRGWRGV